jgi:hypothetical protein
VDPLADLLRAYNDNEATGTVSDELIGLAERWDASSPGEPDADNPDAPVLRQYAEGVAPLTDTELTALSDGLTAIADDDNVGITVVGPAADAVVEINAELVVMDDIAQAEDAELAAARARLRGEPAEDNADGDDTEGDDPEAVEDGDDPEAADDTDTDPADPQADAEPEPVLAAAARRSSLASLAARSRRTGRAEPPVPAEAGGNRITFAAGLDHFPAHSETRDLDRVDEAITERFEAFAGAGMAGSPRTRVARIHANFAPERRLVNDRGQWLPSDLATTRLGELFAGRREQAMTQVAAGGFCGPAQPIWDVNVMGSTVRPIRDQALTSLQAARGRVVSMVPPRLAGVLGSTGLWTGAMDEEAVADPEVRKAALRIICGDEQPGEIQAIYSYLIYGELLARTYGEWVQAWSTLAQVRHAQVAEQELFDQLFALATPVADQPVELSGLRDFVNHLARLAWHVRRTNRELREFPFRVVTSTDVLDILAEDLSVSAFGDSYEDNLAGVERILNMALASRRVSVTFSPDIEVPAAQTPSAEAVDYPGSVPYVLYPEGWAVHLDTGVLDIGVFRDRALIEANDIATFMESFEGVHRLGHVLDARRGRIALCPSGEVFGFADAEGVCAGVS